MYKSFVALVILFQILISLPTLAQKLPNKQEASIWAPANIKIDGKAGEWGSQLQAYNHATDIYYTIANDDKNLYLIVNVTNPRVIEKLLHVGLTITVNKNNKKNEGDAANKTITYPNIIPSTVSRIIYLAGAKAKSTIEIPRPKNARPDTNDKPIIKSNDSLRRVANSILQINAKEMQVKGFKADSVLSVYNDQGFRIAQSFDKESSYIYELAIPLSALETSTKPGGKLSYQIRLNSRLVNPKIGTHTTYVYINHEPVDVDQDLDATTDFWGEYTLAKAP